MCIFIIYPKNLEQAQCLLYLHPCWKCIFAWCAHTLPDVFVTCFSCTIFDATLQNDARSSTSSFMSAVYVLCIQVCRCCQVSGFCGKNPGKPVTIPSLNYQQYQLVHRMLCMTSIIACGRGTKTWLNSFFFSKLYRCSGGNLLLNHHFHKIHPRLRHHPRKTWGFEPFFLVPKKQGPRVGFSPWLKIKTHLIHGIQEERCPGILEMLTDKLKISTSIQPMMFNLKGSRIQPKPFRIAKIAILGLLVESCNMKTPKHFLKCEVHSSFPK